MDRLLSKKIGVLNLVAITASVIFLFVSSYFTHEVKSSPLSGDKLNFVFSFIGAVILFTSLFFISNSFILRYENKLLLITIAALFLFLHPLSVIDYKFYIVGLIVLWIHFSLLNNQYFFAFFMLGCGSYFFPPLFIAALVILIILTLINKGNKLRFLIKSISGVLLPSLFIVSYFFLMDKDLYSLKDYYLSFINITLPIKRVTIAIVFLIAIITIIYVTTLYKLISKASISSIDETNVIYHQIVYFIIASLIAILFSQHGEKPIHTLCTPIFAIMLYRFVELEKSNRVIRISLQILYFSFVIIRIGYFI